MKKRFFVYATLILSATTVWAQLPSTKNGEWPNYTADLNVTQTP